MLEEKGDSGKLFVVFLLCERKDRRERMSVIFLLRGKWQRKENEVVRNEIRFVDTRTLDSAFRRYECSRRKEILEICLLYFLHERKDRRERINVVFLLREK